MIDPFSQDSADFAPETSFAIDDSLRDSQAGQPDPWTHSVVHESNFVDPWIAQDDAFRLAFEVSLEVHEMFAISYHRLSPKVPQDHATRTPKVVTFADAVEWWTGPEDGWSFYYFSVPLNFSDPKGADPTNISTSHHCLDANRRPGFDTSHSTVADFHQHEDAGIDNASGRKILSAHSLFSDIATKTVPPHGITAPRFSRKNFRTCANTAKIADVAGVVVPLSLKAVLNSSKRAKLPNPQVFPIAVPPIDLWRREHESPIGWLPDAQENEDEDDDFAEDHNQFDHHVLPAFVTDLSHRLARLGFDPEDDDFEVPVRTWYIDHATVRRWTAPRNLQLIGPPQGWEMQFSSLWIDQIDPEEWFDLTIITPDPPRPHALRNFVLDIVVTQALHLPRFAGLVTIIPEDRSRFDFFSVACSFEAHISGFDIINAADAAPLCRHHACRITFGWQEIPNTLRPTHETNHGDGFQVLIREEPLRLASPIESPHTLPTNSAATSSSSASAATPQVHQAPQTRNSTDVSMQNASLPSTAQTNANRFMTPLHIFQFQGHEVVIQLVNNQLVQPSHQIADALNVPFNCLEAIYPIPSRLLGFPELAIPAIVQRTGDIPYRSTDRLILIDVKYVYNQDVNGQVPDPTIVRTVHRIGYQVIRSHLLMTAGVFHYCVHLEDQCTVALDGIDWPSHDHGSRPARHGSYVLIVVPPYADTQLDTRHLAEILQDDGEHDTFMHFLLEPEHEEDATQLYQVSFSTSPLPSVSRFCVENARPPTGDKQEMLPIFHAQPRPSVTLSAVLQPKVELNPQAAPDGPYQTEHVHETCGDRSPHATPTRKPKTKEGSDSCPPRKRGKKGNDLMRQTKIHSFFQASNTTKVDRPKPTQQSVITSFFRPKSEISPMLTVQFDDNLDEIDPQRTGSEHQVTGHHQSESSSPLDRPQMAKCSDEQIASAPNFQVAIPPHAPNAQPPQQPRPIWMLELTSIFEERARVHHTEVGPELEVAVWYVHHSQHPRCQAPRTVRLDNTFDLWYADICTVWFDHIVRQQPLKVLIVKPTPSHALRPHVLTHIILEQGMIPTRVALHFTAVFHGGNRQGIYQVAESVPDRICTDIMIDLHDFWQFCINRPCHMWSGILRFQQDVPEEIFSGMSALLNVHEGRDQSQAAASSSDRHESDATLFMQTGQRPTAGAPTHAQSNQSSPAANDTSHMPMINATEPQPSAWPSQNAPLLQIRDLPQFRQALSWMIDQQPSICPVQAPRVHTVHTWFSDTRRLPRSDHFRAVALGPLRMHWPFEILHRWQDWIDPTEEVTMHLVQPSPSGGGPDVLAHVIVMQSHEPATRAALITVTEMLEDPWHPTSFCTLLPTLVTASDIMQEAGITERIRPLSAQQTCEITHGSIVIQGDMTFPVRHGFQFDVAVASLDEEWDHEVALLQISFARVFQQILRLDKFVQVAMRTVPVEYPGHDDLDPSQAVSLELGPQTSPMRTAEGFASLTFHSVLQSAWQPLSLLSARPHDPSVTVVTWFLDHIRFPQCFAARAVQLYHDPEQWTHTLELAWQDLILHDHPIHFHLVQPDPIEPEPDVALHVLIVQQSVPHFDSVLVSVIDSALQGMPPQRHASMAPHMLPCDTVLGIAYKDQDCGHPSNTCSVWIGDRELLPHEVLPVYNGLALTVAIHRHIAPDPDNPDPWDLLLPEATTPSSPACDNPDILMYQRMSDLCLANSLRSAHPSQSTRQDRAPTIHRVPLCLDAVIQPQPHTEWTQLHPETSALLWYQQTEWTQHCSSFSVAPPVPLPDGLQIHPASYDALLSQPLETDPILWTWELYVDGSVGTTGAGWSVIVVCSDDSRTVFQGCYAGQVQLAPEHPQWFGADAIDNISAELTAFLVAQDLCLRFLPRAKVTIRPDLMLSQAVATFEHITHASPTLAQMCRVLSGWLGKATRVRQVPAHRGNPWNELADSLAKWAAAQDPATLPSWNSPGLHSLASSPHDLHWCWLQTASDRFLACFPPIVQHEVMQFPPSETELAPPRCRHSQEEEWITLAFSCVTANVLALDHFEHQNEIGRQTGTRTARIDHQLHMHQTAIIGIQEARTKQGRYRSEHYHIFAAGFQGPNPVCLGCELWIHQTLPIATLHNGQSLTFADFKITTQWADPRRLFVLLENHELTLSFIVLHAPCLSKNKGDGTRPIDHLTAWWQETARLFAAHATSALTWVFIDANAPLNQDFYPFVGTAGAEAMNPQGRLFGQFLTDHELYVPSTFEHFHDGPGATWTHSNGAKYRRDYVLVSKQVFSIVVHTRVLVDFDNTFCHEDHLPLQATIRGLQKAKAVATDRHVWDDQAFLCPVRTQQFRQALATLPIPSWNISADSHAAWYEMQLLQLGKQFFSKCRHSRRRPVLSPATLNAIAMKRHLLDCARLWNLTSDPTFKETIKPLEKEVRHAVRHDLGIYYDQLLVQLQTSDSMGDLRTVFKTLGRLGGRNRKSSGSIRPLPLLQKPDGTLTTTFLERQWVWMEQFAAIEAGQTIEHVALTAMDAARPAHPLDLQEPASFPTAWDIQQGLRKIKRGRAPGPNGIPPALLKAGGEVFARQFLPLVTKCAAHSHEPLSWKGGRLFPLHKGKMHPSLPEGYRSIFVSDFTAKLYHMTLRRPLELAWSRRLHSLQFGGRKGQGTDTAHHMLQVFWHWTTAKRTPSAIVFFDVRAAFYSVIRETMFASKGDIRELSQLLTTLGLTDELARAIAPSVDTDFALEGLSPHALAILHDAMTNTHFFIEGIDQPCRTRRGTRPGDPIGDILFNMIMSCILKDAKLAIQDTSDLQWYGSPEQCSSLLDSQCLPPSGYFDVSFVDDCAFALHGQSVQQVEVGIQAVVEAMITACRQRGLVINFEQGKTEVLWNVTGKGSKARKAALAAEGNQLRWISPEGPLSVRIAFAYKHLGTWLQSGHVHGKEVQQRSALAKSTWGALARPFYNKPYVSLPAKAKIFQSTALSQFMYNAHVWTGVASKEWDKWHNALRKPFCLMVKPKLRGVNPLHLDTDAVAALAGILPPRHALHVARLRYLRRLTQNCPRALWNLIMADADTKDSWMHACVDSFQWFRLHYAVPFAPASDDLQDWLPIISLDSSWKGRLRKAASSCLQYCLAIAERQVFLLRFSQSFEAAGGLLPETTQPIQEKWQCDQCSRCFPSKRGLASHAARAHGYKRLERFYATHATCDACGKFYHARARLLMHLYDCPECLRTIQACFPPATEEQVEQLDEEGKQYASDMRQQGWWKTKAFQPPLRIQGPLLPPPDSEDAKAFKAKWDLRNPVPGSSYRELQGRLAVPGQAEEPQVVLLEADMPAFVMHAPPGPNQGGGAFSRNSLAAETARLHIKWLVFVHFFSGFRRTDDLQAVLESMPLENCAQLLVISVDMCMQRKDGNLATDTATSWWLNRVRSGQIVGAGGAPPAKRLQQLASSQTDPGH